ncbi:MAG: hypothetical protein ACKV0T_00465 [Planctomycetales bacterium]
MNQDFVLRKLSEIMDWETDKATNEFNWLKLMSRMKYDGYQDFLAGARFIESLADWLQQFEKNDRAAAYALVRSHLVYVSNAEMNHLVELFYPETVQWRIQRAVTLRLGIPRYRIWATSESVALYERMRRQTLFIELSDGARIDVFRRANAGLVSNEQVVTAPRFNQEKWDDLLKHLRQDLRDESARFAFVFLIDDFIASGTTLFRKEDGVWKGKLQRFWNDAQGVLKTHFELDWTLCVHHYLATHRGWNTLLERHRQAKDDPTVDDWFKDIKFSYGAKLPEDLPLNFERHAEFLALTEKYYDNSIKSKHFGIGGEDARLGFGACALPLILEHNTPNNSVALLWAETLGGNGRHPMRPLFRRRERHT